MRLNNLILELYNIEKKHNIFYMLFSVIYSVLMILGNSYHVDNTLNHLFSNINEFFINFSLFIFQFIFIFFICKLLILFLRTNFNNKINIKNKFLIFYEKYEMIFSILIMFFAWLPGLIIAYPFIADWDTWQTLYEVSIPDAIVSGHHPLAFHIMLIIFINIGNFFGSASFGLFINTLFVYLLYIVILTYSLYLLKKLNASVVIRLCILSLYAISPLYSNYAIALLKDPIYSIFCVLFCIELIFLFIHKNLYFKSVTHSFLLFISAYNVSILRNNGKYIIACIIFILILYIIFKVKSEFSIKKLLCYLLLSLTFGLLSNFAIMKINKWLPASIRELTSVPMQQIGRYVKYYSDELDSNDIENINKLSSVENFKKLYNPLIADNLKFVLKKTGNVSDYISFGKEWIKLVLRHPGTAISAVLNQNYILFNPYFKNFSIFTNYFPPENYRKLVADNYFDNKIPFEKQRKILNTYFKSLYNMPIISLLFSPFLYVFVLLFLMLYYLLNFSYTHIILLLIPFSTLLIIFLGPTIFGFTRYTLPIIYTIPIIIKYKHK